MKPKAPVLGVPVLGGALALIMLAAGPASAQQVPIEQMSLPDALDFLRGAILSQGTIAYQGNVRDSNSGQTWTYTRSISSTNVTTDPANCQINFHYTVVTNGDASTATDVPNGGVPFRLAAAIETATEETMIARRDAQSGHASWVSVFTPEVWDVTIVRSDGQQNVLSFYSKGVADQAAEAAQRARQLCNGD